MFKVIALSFAILALGGCSAPSDTVETSVEHVQPVHLCTCGDPATAAEGCSNQCFLDPNSQCTNSKCTCVPGHAPYLNNDAD